LLVHIAANLSKMGLSGGTGFRRVRKRRFDLKRPGLVFEISGGCSFMVVMSYPFEAVVVLYDGNLFSDKNTYEVNI